MKRKKKPKPTAEKWDVNVNLTVVIPKSELSALREMDEDVEQYLESNLDVSFPFGDAWICGLDSASKMEDA